ncbi:MAG: hypothetical protein AAF572_16615 [Cyanobacteria bacterium P01_B01_bin.77]
MLKLKHTSRLGRVISLIAIALVPPSLISSITLRGNTQPICSSTSKPARSQLQPIWDRVNQAPFLHLVHQDHSEGENFTGIEQYVRPERYRRVIYSPRYPQSESPIAGIETIIVGDQVYHRIGEESVQLYTSDQIAFHTRQPYFGEYFLPTDITELAISGPVTLPQGETTCVYTYQVASQDESGMITYHSAETLWVDSVTGYPHQMKAKSTIYDINPPIFTERQTNFDYSASLQIEIPEHLNF